MARMNKPRESQDPTSPPSESVTLAGLAAAGSLGFNVGEKAWHALRSPEPVLVQVLDSRFDEQHHRVSVMVTNQTLHGIYLESVSLDLPAGKSFTVSKPVSAEAAKNLSFGEKPEKPPLTYKASEWQAWLVHPGKAVSFELEIDPCNNTKTNHSTLELGVSRLEEKNPTTLKTHFRLRR